MQRLYRYMARWIALYAPLSLLGDYIISKRLHKVYSWLSSHTNAPLLPNAWLLACSFSILVFFSNE